MTKEIIYEVCYTTYEDYTSYGLYKNKEDAINKLNEVYAEYTKNEVAASFNEDKECFITNKNEYIKVRERELIISV